VLYIVQPVDGNWSQWESLNLTTRRSLLTDFHKKAQITRPEYRTFMCCRIIVVIWPGNLSHIRDFLYPAFTWQFLFMSVLPVACSQCEEAFRTVRHRLCWGYLMMFTNDGLSYSFKFVLRWHIYWQLKRLSCQSAVNKVDLLILVS